MPVQNVRTRTQNIVKHSFTKDALDSWLLFFNQLLIDLIVGSTIIFINSIKDKYTTDKSLTKFTIIKEMKAYFGLSYIAWVLHGGKLNITEFWHLHGTGVEIFKAGISLRQFRFLTRYIRFDDIQTRNNRGI